MHQTGVLLAIFPEWHEIECLVVRDFYHRYTVDEHTLEAIDAIASLREYQASRTVGVSPSWPPNRKRNCPLVYLALLFHDCGKSDGLESHAARSADLAAGAFERIQVPAEVREGGDLSDSNTISISRHHAVARLERPGDDAGTQREGRNGREV